ncbi:MAG TPA: hypothetical protein PKK26_03255 [Candidatus Wallbacteria bacterium]|nr:hypothetical protein [Candidatus Wallbacteria bacterium]
MALNSFWNLICKKNDKPFFLWYNYYSDDKNKIVTLLFIIDKSMIIKGGTFKMKLNITLILIFVLLVLAPSSYAQTSKQQQLDDWAAHYGTGTQTTSSTASTTTSTQEQLDDWARHVTPWAVPQVKPVTVAPPPCTTEVSATTTTGASVGATTATTCTNEVTATTTTGTNSVSVTGTTGAVTATTTTGGTHEVIATTSGGTNSVSVTTSGTNEVTATTTSGTNSVSVTTTSGTSEVSTTTSSTTEVTAAQHAANLDTVKGIYKGLVGADPEVKLLNFLTNALDRKAFTVEQITVAITASDEYKAAHRLGLE